MINRVEVGMARAGSDEHRHIFNPNQTPQEEENNSGEEGGGRQGFEPV